MSFHVSAHAQAEMHRRGIPRAMVDAVLGSPEQIVAEQGGIMCYQLRVTINEKPYLLRVMVNEASLPRVVVTVYRTSKISKYWRQP
jgi:hypothetical protein